MRLMMIAATLAAALATPALAADPAGPARAVIETFVAGFNDPAKLEAAKATHVASPVIIDEPPPYLWTGRDAMETWLADQHKEALAMGRTDEKVTLGRTLRAEMAGGQAYVIVAATYRYTEKGVPKAEPSRMTYVLKSGRAGWKIAAWTWTGPRGIAVKAKPSAPMATPQ
ncbi:hypothetical protein [Sandarakinorhabdus oryzae]|uniref:hypothetical protein n=1 Tax=Sandarakinorhabdus oryzae TaxID=2675220 RepID=UPI0012E2095F|nr:hypothetical protein [Sandarakinorhabdus oryzae]